MLISLLTVLPVFFTTPFASEAAIPAAASEVARPEKEHAQPRLIVEKTAATPGSTMWIAVTFTIDESWHIYWDGQNDSGLPVTGKWTLPEGGGVKMGTLEWPAPKRAVYDDIKVIDYTYEKKVTAIAELTIDKTVKPDQIIKIDASLKWLVCQDRCIPGKKDVSLEIKIVQPGTAITDSVDAPLFVEARKTIPKPAKEGESVISRRWDGTTLILAVKDATGLIFYPDSKCAPMTDAIGQGESKTGELNMDFEAKSGTIAPVTGIVEVRRADSKPTEFYKVSIPGKDRKE